MAAPFRNELKDEDQGDFMSRISILLLALAFVSILIAPTADADTIKIGMIAPEQTQPAYQPLLDHLNRSGTHRFDLVFYSNMNELYADFSAKKARLAIVGSVFYAKVHAKLGVIPVVKDRQNIAAIIVQKDSKIMTIEDLRGSRLSLGYPDSTTSNLIPRMVLWQHKIKRDDLTDSETVFSAHPEKIFFSYAGSHSNVIEEVLSGKADAGAVVDAVFEDNKTRGLRAIHTSEPYPGVPLICHKDESDSFVNEIRQLFTSFRPVGTSENYHFCKGAKSTKDSDYDSVRYLCNIVLGTDYAID